MKTIEHVMDCVSLIAMNAFAPTALVVYLRIIAVSVALSSNAVMSWLVL